MPAPVTVTHTHVHAMRLASGAEVLVARVLIALTGVETAEGFGFTHNQEAMFARDMAAWDALARSRGVPLARLLGAGCRSSIPVHTDLLPALAPDWAALHAGLVERRYDLLRIDPWNWGIEQVARLAALASQFNLDIGLVAPHAHPWELAFCATLAAAAPGANPRILVPVAAPHAPIAVSEAPGAGITWSSEPAFASLKWQP